MGIRQVFDGLGAVLPEAVLGAAILVVILADLVPSWKKGVPAFFALAGLAGALVAVVLTMPASGRAVFHQAYAVDGFGAFAKIAFLGAALLVAVFSIPAIREWKMGKGEYFALLLSCTFGMTLMAGANDLLMMYLALEFVSITSYIMAGMLRKNRRSAEASLKYIIYGAGASGFMIYGMSYLYGLTGTLQIAEVGRRMVELGGSVPVTLQLIMSTLIMAGFAYKIAAAPFHMWCPDVYEGAPTPVTAFFSVGPKAAGFVMLIRFLHNVFPAGSGGAFEWKAVLAMLAVLTMAVGNFGALQQQNLKRLLAYSSIAHAGYMLVAFVAFTPETVAAVLFYLVVYVLMNLGAFLVVIVLEEKYGVETVEGCRGLGWRAPHLGVLMTVFLFSLTGLPPTAGFIGKVLVFSGVIQQGLGNARALGISLVVIASLFTVISLFYYARIVAAMFLGKPREGADLVIPAGRTYSVLLWLLAAGTVGFGLLWGPLQEMTRAAAKSILTGL